MPRSPQQVSESGLRKSARARKTRNTSFSNDLPEDVVNAVMKGAKEELKMPEGWNPSDDSEDEYKPRNKRNSPASGKKKRDDSSDSDSPTNSRTPKAKKTGPGPKSRTTVSPIVPAKPTTPSSAPVKMRTADVKPPVRHAVPGKASVDQVHDCLICNARDGRNLNIGSGISDLKYHYAVCYYEDNGVNHYLAYMDQGEVNKDDNGGVIEEYGARFKYKCPFKDCPKNKARVKDMGFKEWCIHSGVAHHLVEKVMEDDLEARPELEPVLEAIRRHRDGAEIVDIPSVPVEEVHVCLICEGKDRKTGKEDKDAKHLSLTENVWRSRYHYSSCLFDTGVYLEKYPPGPENTDENGGVKDPLGREIKYSCKAKGCGQKRMMGYKEFCIHMGNDHNGLDEILREHPREDVRKLAARLEKKK